MCGVFGYLCAKNRKPNLRLLRELTIVTETRGYDAFGLAWLDADGEVGVFKHTGRPSHYLDALDMVKNARIIIGHCRLATHGSPDFEENNHPHEAGDGLIVHNGTVPNYLMLAEQYKLRRQTECDSEVLGLLLKKIPGKLDAKAKKLLGIVNTDMAILGMWNEPARMLVMRQGKPLHFSTNKSGLYLASLPWGLPGDVKIVKNRWAGVLAL